MLTNIFRGMCTKVLVAAINFLILIISSRYLGASSRGEISLYLLNIALVQLVCEIYTGYGLLHFIPKFNFRRLLINGILFVALMAPVSYFSLVVAGTTLPGFVWLGFVTTVFVVFNTFNCVLVLGRERVREYNALSLLQPACLLIGMVYAIFSRRVLTFEAFCWPLLASFVIAGTVSAMLVARLPHRFSKEFRIAPLLLNGTMYQGATIMFILCNRFSYYLLDEAYEVGIYSAAASMMDAALVLASSIAPILISRVANQGDNRESASLSLSLSKLSVVVTLLAILVVLVLPDSFFVFVLGPGFGQLRTVMLAYAPAALLLSFFTAFSAYFSATGRQKIVLYAYGAGFVTTLVLAPAMVMRFSVYGAAFSAAISFLVVAVLLTFIFLRSNSFSLKRIMSIKRDILNFRHALVRELGG